ncbi:hypothetical protein EVAR_8838_1 [Eumeta japonica]|uniref:Uncharacterized protein n=1 Tax=Eumeta variegata TaxID=151549 RepID=A0A4C1TU15_EUMVA|nr:hypothetical protein EVAR_8838_1 [Eumeta japonica]
MRRFSNPDPSFFFLHISILRHCDAFVTNFTAAQFRALYLLYTDRAVNECPFIFCELPKVDGQRHPWTPATSKESTVPASLLGRNRISNGRGRGPIEGEVKVMDGGVGWYRKSAPPELSLMDDTEQQKLYSVIASLIIMMKFLFAFALVAVASASTYVKPTQPTQEMLEIQEIMAAIQSPSTHPATAAALEAHLLDLLGISNPNPEPISVGPAIVDTFEPISVGPAIVDFEHVEPAPVEASPALVPESAASSPLVQIILNINQASSVATPVEAAPVEASPAIPSPVVPEPVQVVEQAPEPVQVVESAPEPVQVVESAPEPVQVVDITPVAPVVMPETLN